jgi:hypothetical protein
LKIKGVAKDDPKAKKIFCQNLGDNSDRAYGFGSDSNRNRAFALTAKQ